MQLYTRSSIQFDEEDMKLKILLAKHKISIVATWRKGAEAYKKEIENAESNL